MKNFLMICLVLFLSTSVFASTNPSCLMLDDKPYIDVREYGAKGDNTTDNYAALQAAFNAANTANCDVYIPSGTYWASCTSPLLLYTGLVGNGADSKIRITSPVGATRDGLCVVGNNAYLRDFAIVDTDAPGVYASSVSDLTIERVVIDDLTPSTYQASSYNLGIYIENCSNVAIHDCNISDVGYDGIYLGAVTHAVVTGNTISDFERIGIVVEQVGTDNSRGGIEITGNNISNANNSDSHLAQHNGGIWVENTDGNIRITGNNISDISGNAGQTLIEPFGITIGSGITSETAHLIETNRVDMGTTAAGICCVVRSDGPAVSIVRGNTFDTARIGIEVAAGHATKPLQVILDANTFHNYVINAANEGLILFDNGGGSVVLDTLIISNLVFDSTVTGSYGQINMYGGKFNYLLIDNARCDPDFNIFPESASATPAALFSVEFRNCYLWNSSDITIRSTNCKINTSTIYARPFQPDAASTTAITNCTFPVGGYVNALASFTQITGCIFDQVPLRFYTYTGDQYLKVSDSEFIASTSSNCIIAPLNSTDANNHMTVSNCVFRGVPYAGVTGAYVSYASSTYPYGLYYIHDNIYDNLATFTSMGTSTGTTTLSDNQAF